MIPNVLAAAARKSFAILLWQAGCVAGLAMIAVAFWDARTGWSVLAGGGIGLIWTVYMALTLFRHSLNHGVRLSAASFVAGWLIKVTLTLALMALAFRSPAIVPLALLGGLVGSLAAYWVCVTFRVNHADRANGK